MMFKSIFSKVAKTFSNSYSYSVPEVSTYNSEVVNVGNQDLYKKFSPELYDKSEKLHAEGVAMLIKPDYIPTSTYEIFATLGVNMIHEANNNIKTINNICAILHEDTCEWIKVTPHENFSTEISGEIEGFSVVHWAEAA